jgi:hypothetical protein
MGFAWKKNINDNIEIGGCKADWFDMILSLLNKYNCIDK